MDHPRILEQFVNSERERLGESHPNFRHILGFAGLLTRRRHRELGRAQARARAVGLVVACTLAGGFARLVAPRRGPVPNQPPHQLGQVTLVRPSAARFTRALASLRRRSSPV